MFILADILNEYNNTYYRKIKMNVVNLNSGSYIGFNGENNKKDPKFEVGDHVPIWKYKNIFPKV